MAIILEEVDPPICAQCGVQVERFSVFEDVNRDERVFVAQCHGETQTVRVGMETFVSTTSVQFGRAFEKTAKELSP